MKKTLTLTALLLASTFSYAAPESKGEVLVLLSSETTMTLKSGETIETGYYLNEFGIPAKALVDEGYELVLATPKGNKPSVDQKSVTPDYFDGDKEKMEAIQKFIDSLPGINDTLSLKEVIDSGLDDYKAVFIPGGHAPLIDLANNSEVGEILTHFHHAKKPTAAICHGPIALLSAQETPEKYMNSLREGEKGEAGNWIYQGYNMTIFSDPEELAFESRLKGEKLSFYPAAAMSQAGGEMTFVDAWQPNVIVDKELITGQNPFSDDLLAQKLLEMLAQ